MCGIVGMYTTESMGFTHRDKDEFFSMLVVDSLRGIHSTGVFGVPLDADFNEHELDTEIVKSVSNPYYFMQQKEAKDFFNKIPTKYGIVVGHNRYATKGEVNAQNAHPFEEGNITLVHNGTISNYEWLKSKYGNPPVDSQLVARMIDSVGIEETILDIGGAYAFVWYDKKDDTLNMVRNSQRPFWLGKYKNFHHLVFASERATLAWHADRHSKIMDNIWELPINTWYKYSRGDITPEIKEVKTYRVYSAPVVTKPSLPHVKVQNCTVSTSDQKSEVLSLNTVINVNILDYKEISKNVFMLYCCSDYYPSVHAQVVYKGEEDDILNSDTLSAKIVNISWIDNGSKVLKDAGFNWSLMLTEPVLDMVETKSEDGEWVLLGTGETIRDYRINEMIRKQGSKCFWCDGKMPEAKAPSSKVGIYSYPDGVKDVEVCICPSCTNKLVSNIT